MSKPRPSLAHAADGDVRARKRSTPRTILRRIAAAATTLVLGTGLALVAVAAPASAHHNTVTGVAVCNPQTGTFDITWTVTNSERITETITESSDESVVPEQTKLGDRESKDFSQLGVAPGTYTLTLSAEWENGHTNSSFGTVEVKSTGCAEPVEEIAVPAEPEPVDVCGVDGDRIVQPAAVEGVEWTITPVVDGTATATATVTTGFVFPGGKTSETWTYQFDSTECTEPTLEGSVVTGVCDADAPWIFFDIALVDPDGQSDADAASLVLTDGVNTETLELGTLGDDGALEGRILWPGASVADDGVTPTGWPGWEQVDGEWIETDGNFAWTRDVTTATLVVNPELDVAISYPEATPDCAAAPPQDENPGGEGVAVSGTGLASTGFAGTSIAIVAGVIVIAGLAFLVIARVRRKRT